MESQVMGYFFAIGFGLTAGISVVALPTVLVYQKIKNRKGRTKNAQF